MKSKHFLLIFIIIFLTACAPKYPYLNPDAAEAEFDHILVVFDYLHFVDDVGKLLDYPEDKNQQQIEVLKNIIK